jgi:hypothetical protein
MKRVRKLLGLSGVERWLLAVALVVLVAIRLGLWLLPFRILRPLLARVSRPRGASVDDETVNQIAWAVSTAAPHVPSATCLTQALAAQALLARLGASSDLRIGVARDERLGVRAHAWLERRGRVVIGGSSLDRYIPLPASASDGGSCSPNGGVMMDDRNRTKRPDTGTAPRTAGDKRPYRSPMLTEYGSVEDLVDAGVVGTVTFTLPSISILQA